MESRQREKYQVINHEIALQYYSLCLLQDDDQYVIGHIQVTRPVFYMRIDTMENSFLLTHRNRRS